MEAEAMNIFYFSKVSISKFICATLALSSLSVMAWEPDTSIAINVLAAIKTFGLTLKEKYTPEQQFTPDGQVNHKAEFWPWPALTTSTDPHQIAAALPKDFLWGSATSAHQVEEDCTNNDWSNFATCKTDAKGVKHYKTYKAGKACEHIKYFDQDVALMKNELGANAYRFSVEWSKIEPREGEFDEKELARYEQWCTKLNALGIAPVITLHHYTSPLWFVDKGHFANAENIKYFVRFCTKVYERLHTQVKIWITFNAPSGYALQGFGRGVYAPGIEGGLGLAVQVTKNILEAHVQIYKACKKIDSAPQIGILHHYYPLKVYDKRFVWDKLGCLIGNNINNSALLEFFRTGNFNTTIPWMRHYNADAPHCLDFMGLSFYSHGHLKNFKPGFHADHELRTEKPNFVVYGEGLYHAIKEVSTALGKGKDFPIYITENGVATADTPDGDALRETFMRRYLYALTQATREGYNIKGYFYWSFMDNYEWIEEYTKQFGLYKVDFSTQKRTLRPSSHYYINVIKAHTTHRQ